MIPQQGPEEQFQGCEQGTSTHTGLPYALGDAVCLLAPSPKVVPKAAHPCSMPDHQPGQEEHTLPTKLLDKA